MKKQSQKSIEQITDIKRWYHTTREALENKIRDNQRRLEEIAMKYLDAQRTLDQKQRKFQLQLKITSKS